MIRLDQIPILRGHLQDKLGELEKIKTEIEDLENKLRDGVFSLDEREAITAINQDLQKLKPSVDRYLELLRRVEELEGENIVSKYSEQSTQIKQKPKIAKKIENAHQKKKRTEHSIEAKKAEISKKQRTLEDGKAVLAHINELEVHRTEHTDALGSCRETIAAVQSRFTSVKDLIKETEGTLKKYHKKAQSKYILEEVRRWLIDILVPAVSNIERNVLASINKDFNEVFQSTFNTLVESEDISVSITETFSPQVEQEGWGTDVDSLSGGEKTSVALAYRLALNTIVKKQVPTLRSSLLILDEPTDGFSSNQLNKLRDILVGTRCEQIIMVSHEKELEGFVDSICKVEKQNGVSRVIV